jgi:predicted 3-demethylubiquinone-9 3-methyltransferase (glyoxalase superfamily)|tara:strand:+ start:108 stop:347 length:240 start_codon:yes stop_codon:yes gene_type:complete
LNTRKAKQQTNKERDNMDNDKVKLIMDKIHSAAWLAIDANTNTNISTEAGSLFDNCDYSELYNDLYNAKLNEIKTLLEG